MRAGPAGPTLVAMRSWPIAVLLLLLVASSAGVTVDDASAAKKRKPTAAVCPAGTTPIVVKRGRKAVLKRDRRGRLRCRSVKRSSVRAPAKTLTADRPGRGSTALGGRHQSQGVQQDRAGHRRAPNGSPAKLGLTAWRKTAGAASTETENFSAGGADGKATFGVDKVEGERSGFRATASAEMKVSRADLEKYSPDLKDRLPEDVKGASAKVDVSFEDIAATCPNDKGAVPGKLRGKGTITVTVERSGGPPIKFELSADVNTTYTAQMGPDGKVSAINGVEVQTTFQAGGSGTGTETYRGRVLGTGFGTEGIIGAPAGTVGARLERDFSHIDPDSGGVFGPHGSWRYGRGFPISDLRTVDNVKAMAATNIATQLLTVASLEYLRKVTLDRIEKSPCGYSVQVDLTSRTVTASYDAFGKLQFPVVTRPVAGSATRWRGTAEALFTDLSFTAKSECVMHTPVNTPGTFTIDLERLPSGNLQVTWSADPSTSASIDCPPDDSDPPHDPPPIPGMVGPSLLGATPATFELPADGGAQAIAGGIDGGDGDGFFPSGTLVVSRNK